jgi:ribosomal protein S27AE
MAMRAATPKGSPKWFGPAAGSLDALTPRWTLGRGAKRKNGYVEYLIIIFFFGLATGIIGRAKGSSFFIWFVIGAVLPLLGLIAVILYRVDKDEPERQCPTCGKALKLYVQVCPRCGTDLYLPDPAAVRHPGVR